jgi:hypothetical protein
MGIKVSDSSFRADELLPRIARAKLVPEPLTCSEFSGGINPSPNGQPRLDTFLQIQRWPPILCVALPSSHLSMAGYGSPLPISSILRKPEEIRTDIKSMLFP